MKKSIFLFSCVLFSCVWLLACAPSMAQVRYESYNFYGNGITEYVEVEVLQMTEFTYYTSANPNRRIKLILSVEDNQWYLQFPADERKYRWIANDEFGISITCLHPTGASQPYTRSAEPNPPFKYLRSKNPYTGLIEELKVNDETFWYRSNKRPAWVKLHAVRKERPAVNSYGYDVYFPNDKNAYKLTFLEGMMDMQCANPDGTTQLFHLTNVVTVK